ncbi:hypothetical protein NLI96_g438 [Meripilus lineatus]|uniref:UbiA prenyltransferase n=1 Tax=Meripilus lineatus TaxID=2056292 RepID=A0AAD5YNX5_9APHY|nr:hypothetical protein NLI96_g438 [Physisporinus lineatus]
MVATPHLFRLQFSVQSLVQDQINKASRLIPSSRITVTQAKKLRWVLIFLSLLTSGYHGNLVAAAIILVADVVYNDLGFSTWWFTKSLLNAVGYVGFQYGAVTIASATNDPIDNQVFGLVITFGFLVFTTTHVQDFYDAEGDQAVGRQTAATLYPKLSRVLAAMSISAWAMALPIIWDITLMPSTIFTLLGTFVAGRFILLSGRKSDETSFLHYNIGILIGCILPAFREVRHLA